MGGGPPSVVGACPRPRHRDGRAHRCRSRRCPSCGLLWAGDTRVKLLANIAAYGGDVVMVTATAPGAKRLPDPRAIREWNDAAPGRWRRLHSAAAQAVRREGHPFAFLGRTFEYQRRGALHVHAVVGVHSARELHAAHRYVFHLDRLRDRHDFGFVDRGRGRGDRRALEVIPAERAARYMAKYLAPIQGGKLTLSETVLRPDCPPPRPLRVAQAHGQDRRDDALASLATPLPHGSGLLAHRRDLRVDRASRSGRRSRCRPAPGGARRRPPRPVAA